MRFILPNNNFASRRFLLCSQAANDASGGHVAIREPTKLKLNLHFTVDLPVRYRYRFIIKA